MTYQHGSIKVWSQCSNLRQLWRAVPVAHLHMGSAEDSLWLHFTSVSTSAWSDFILFHECWSWKHSSINFLYTNLHLKVCFWGNPSGDNRILSPISWTHYVAVTRSITNYNSWTYQKGLYMLSMCFPCLEYPGCFCQANSHSSSKTQLKTQFHYLLEASSQHVFTSIPNMCSFRSLCFPLSHILLYQSVIIYLLACARLRLS